MLWFYISADGWTRGALRAVVLHFSSWLDQGRLSRCGSTFQQLVGSGASLMLWFFISAVGWTRGAPHAAVLHWGTSSLANYFFSNRLGQPWDDVVDRYVQLAQMIRDAYNDETLIVVSDVLPRINR